MRINNYVGYKIGMITVLEKTKQKNNQGRPIYKCKCECGNIVYYTSSDLKESRSCVVLEKVKS